MKIDVITEVEVVIFTLQLNSNGKNVEHTKCEVN